MGGPWSDSAARVLQAPRDAGPSGASIRLSEDEARAFPAAGRAGARTTRVWTAGRSACRRGSWCWTDDDTQTPAGAKKAARVRRDSRAAFLVETGTRWTELSAVHVEGRAEIVSDAEEAARASTALDQKYEAFGMPRAEVPDATKQHYRAPAVIRIIPDGKVLTWDNARCGSERSADPPPSPGP